MKFPSTSALYISLLEPLWLRHCQGKKRLKKPLTLSPQFASLVVLNKYSCSTEEAISVSTSHMVSLLKANAPFRVREPPAGLKKLSLSLPESTFPKIWSISPTLAEGRSRATEFPQTSRLHYQNPHAKSFRLEASQRNLSTRSRDITIFVKKMLRKSTYHFCHNLPRLLF